MEYISNKLNNRSITAQQLPAVKINMQLFSCKDCTADSAFGDTKDSPVSRKRCCLLKTSDYVEEFQITIVITITTTISLGLNSLRRTYSSQIDSDPVPIKTTAVEQRILRERLKRKVICTKYRYASYASIPS